MFLIKMNAKVEILIIKKSEQRNFIKFSQLIRYKIDSTGTVTMEKPKKLQNSKLSQKKLLITEKVFIKKSGII